MTATAARLATYEDLCALPDDVRAEVVNGTIITAPAPLPKHSWAQRALGRFIGGPFADDDGYGGPGGWWLFVEVDVAIDTHNIVRPDLAGWRRKRLPDPAEQRPITVRPDWVCEILSPSTAARDRIEKRQLYATAGIPHYWIVDVDARTLEVFELGAGRWTLVDTFGEHSVARVPPFEEVELAVGRLFLPRPG